MSKTLNKYITALDYTNKTLLVLTVAFTGVSLCSFTTVIGTPVRIVSATISLVFLISKEMVKMFLKSMRKKKTSTERLLY